MAKAGSEVKKSPIKQPPPEIKRETEVEKYFNNIFNNKISPEALSPIKRITRDTEKSFSKSIRRGEILVKQEPSNLSTLLIKEAIDEQFVKQEELKKKRQQILKAIANLDMRMKRSSSEVISHTNKQLTHPELLHYKPNTILSKEQHEQMVQKITRAQEAQKKRQEEMLYNLQKKLKEEERKIKDSEEQRINTEKQLRKMRSENNLAARKQHIEDLKSLEVQSRKDLQSLKKKKFLHEKMEENFNNSVTIPSLEEKKKKLKEIREISRAFDSKKIDEHEKKYLEERNKSMHQLHSRSRVGEEWVYKKPEKSERLTKILEDQITNKKKDLVKHDKEIEERLIRQQNYVRLLREKHQPKVDENLRSQLDFRMEKIHTQRREAKVDTRQEGLLNLNIAKKLKSSKVEEMREGKSVQENAKASQISAISPSRINYLKIRNDSEYYSEKKKHNLQKILNEESDAVEKEKKLKIENSKIEEALKMKEAMLKVDQTSIERRKETAELLLSGIKAKMGLIQLAD